MIVHPGTISSQTSKMPTDMKPPHSEKTEQGMVLTSFQNVKQNEVYLESIERIKKGEETSARKMPPDEIKRQLDADRRALELKRIEISAYQERAVFFSEEVNTLTQQISEANGPVGADLRDRLEFAQTELYGMQRLNAAAQDRWETIAPVYLEQIATAEALLADYENDPASWDDPE